MAFEFLSLPCEIRVEIYQLVFGSGKAIMEAKNEDGNSCLIPQGSKLRNPAQRSSQLLRVSRAILDEARPILYANTTFHILSSGFAGKLPLKITNGHPLASYLKNWIWQLDCDMLKHHYPEDLCLDTAQAAQWNSFELRCRAESWRDSFLGEWCDREAFIAGREQVINYARILALVMSDSNHAEVDLTEDRSQLGREPSDRPSSDRQSILTRAKDIVAEVLISKFPYEAVSRFNLAQQGQPDSPPTNNRAEDVEQARQSESTASPPQHRSNTEERRTIPK